MSADGRDLLGRPIFSHGLGVGDGRSRELEEIRRNMGTRVLPEEGPLRPPVSDPHVRMPEEGYGGDGILGRRGDVADPYWGRPHTTVLPPDPKAPPAPPPPPPMGGGMHRHSASGDPEVYSSTPRERAQGIQTYGGGPLLSDTVAGLQNVVAGLKQRDVARDAEMTEIRGALGAILKKFDAEPAARPCKPAGRRIKAKGTAR
jgi:hypothetical protein